MVYLVWVFGFDLVWDQHCSQELIPGCFYGTTARDWSLLVFVEGSYLTIWATDGFGLISLAALDHIQKWVEVQQLLSSWMQNLW